MRKSIMQLAKMTMVLIVGVAAAAPPAFANCCCHWRHHHHVAAAAPHAHWAARPRWALAFSGWGPGVGFERSNGVSVDRVATYNHPYYYGGGPYGNCGSARPVLDAGGLVVGWQRVYVC